MHETDYQRARRQRQEVKKHGVTGSTPEDAAKRIKEHSGFDSHKRWGNSATKGHGVNSPAMMEARKRALENKKEAGKAISSMIRYNREIKKRDPHSYSSGVHQEKAIKEKYPHSYESYRKSPISEKKAKEGKFGY